MSIYFVRSAVRCSAVPRHSTIVAAAAILLAAGAGGHAQLVTPKTVPIHGDDQFAIFPSAYAGMGGASLALDDTLADPFSNPALAARIRRGVVFSAPFLHGVSTGRGGGSTFPIGGAVSAGPWAAAAMIALQRTNQEQTSASSPAQPASNQYGELVLARRLSRGISVGASAYIADLNAMDDQDLLYGGSDQLVQSGTLHDFRIGVTKTWGARRLDFLVLTNRTDVTQDVHYTFYHWTPDSLYVTRLSEHNADRTTIWGAHTQYVQPLSDGWRMGWLATVNRLSHPEIPNYRIQNIPRDPGNTNAYNLGVGLSRVLGSNVFALDAIAEPMYSRTWGTAAHDTVGVGGTTVRAGERTVDNRFTFSNVHLRAGAAHEFAVSRDSSSAWNIQYGLGMYSINYRLRQDDHVQQTSRVADHSWTEWTPTIGLGLRTRSFTLRYNYRRTCGPSTCIDFASGDKVTVTAPGPGGIIAAPAEGSWVEGGVVHVHQFVLTIPIG